MRRIIGSRIGSQVMGTLPSPQSLSFSTKAASGGAPGFNILFFCPRNDKHFQSFNSEYPDFIKEVSPESVSVTDVAHNPENSAQAITSLLRNEIMPEMIIPHLVLIGHNREDTDKKIQFFRDNGIKSMFVVRGNPAVVGKDRDYTHHPDGYEDMPDLMRRIKELAPEMKILVAGYPGKHPFARTFEEDMDELKDKVNCGADGIITQHFFDNKVFLRFLEGCKRRGVDVPIIPSILPIGNPKYLFSFSKSADVDVPADVVKILFGQEGMTTDSETIEDKDVRKRAIDYTSAQIRELMQLEQVPRINTYAANNIPFLRDVLESVGVTKTPERGASR